MNVIIVPVQPPRCPHCHNVENKMEVCRNCKYEYPEEDFPVVLGWLVLGSLIVGAGVGVYYNPGRDIIFSLFSALFGALAGFTVFALGGLFLALLCWLISETFNLKK